MADPAPRPRLSLGKKLALAVLASCALAVVTHLVIGVRLGSATAFMAIASFCLMLSLASMLHMVRGLVEDPLRWARNDVAPGRGTRAGLREEKRRVLRALKELEFDHEMGKILGNDHEAVRDRYRLRAIEVMRQLDGGEKLHPAVQALLDSGSGSSDASAPVAPGTCSGCAQVNDADAAFCKRCGQNLRDSEAT